MARHNPLRLDPDRDSLIALGRRVLALEAETLSALARDLEAAFAEACQLLFAC
nr:hypothetical protein [Acidiferrobacter sp.]